MKPANIMSICERTDAHAWAEMQCSIIPAVLTQQAELSDTLCVCVCSSAVEDPKQAMKLLQNSHQPNASRL
jgi:hypothetical protein